MQTEVDQDSDLAITTNQTKVHSLWVSHHFKSAIMYIIIVWIYLKIPNLVIHWPPVCSVGFMGLHCVLYSLLFLFVLLQEQSYIWYSQETCCCHPAVKSSVTRVMIFPSWLKTVPGDGSNPSQHIKLRKLCNKTHKKSNLLDKLLILYSVPYLLCIAKHSAVIYFILNIFVTF